MSPVDNLTQGEENSRTQELFTYPNWINASMPPGVSLSPPLTIPDSVPWHFCKCFPMDQSIKKKKKGGIPVPGTVIRMGQGGDVEVWSTNLPPLSSSVFLQLCVSHAQAPSHSENTACGFGSSAPLTSPLGPHRALHHSQGPVSSFPACGSSTPTLRLTAGPWLWGPGWPGRGDRASPTRGTLSTAIQTPAASLLRAWCFYS